MSATTPNPVFDQLFEAGAPEVLAGAHRQDTPPVDGGRWPVSVAAFPPDEIRDQLVSWMRRAVHHAGPGHFRTGGRDAVHLTIRALERYREAAAPTEPIVGLWRGAMERTAAATTAIHLLFTGFTLTRTGILAQLEPIDDSAWELMDRLRAELGPEAWLEDAWMKRNIWYASLLHFADEVADPVGLVDWVAEHRSIEPVEFMINSMSLVRFWHREGAGGQAMVPEEWFTVRFGAATV